MLVQVDGVMMADEFELIFFLGGGGRDREKHKNR